MINNERKAQATILTLSILLVVLSVYMSVTMETSATIEACAGCLKMAAGMAN